MSDAPSRDGWTVPSAPEPTRPTIASHRAQCVPCRAGLGACDVGAELEREAAEILSSARARRERDLALFRGERVNEPDPAYPGQHVLRIGEVPARRRKC